MDMNILLGSDKAGLELKNHIKTFLEEKNIDVIDKTPNGAVDFVDSTVLVANEVKKGSDSLAILIDSYGAGSFMAATKIKGIVCAEVSDERTARMTRDHNNTSIITMGAEVVGKGLAESIVMAFINSKYSGGRHQIRVDMLNKMM